MSLGYPEEYGGTPCDTVTLLMIAERVARQGLNNGYSLEILQVRDILEFGNEDQKREVLGLLAEGKAPFALGFTEPGAGSDNNAMATTAVHKDGKVDLQRHQDPGDQRGRRRVPAHHGQEPRRRGPAPGHLHVPRADEQPRA